MMQSRFHIIRIFSSIHQLIYVLSGGRIGTRWKEITFLLLTTVGKKSGKIRKAPLAAIPFGESYVVVASFGGSDVNPSWFVNLKYNAIAQVRIGSTVKKSKVTIVTPKDLLYDDLWKKAVAIYSGFDKYKQATSREIPLVILTPVNS